MATGLGLFREFVKDFRSVTGVVVKGAVAAPLADFLFKLGPPWPGSAPILTTLLELLVLIGAFEFWYASPRKRQRRRMVALFGSLVAFFFIYFFVTSQYTSKHPVDGATLVHGYSLRADARIAMQPGDDIFDLLDGSEFKPEEIWTPASIAIVRLGLLTSWFGLFSSLAGFIAVFVMTQRRITVKPTSPRRPQRRRSKKNGSSDSAPATATLHSSGGKPSGESPGSATERIRNHGERLNDAGDAEGARAADRAERATPERAREIERDFNRGNDRPAGPDRGPGS